MDEKQINGMSKMQKQATSRKRSGNRYSPISMEHTGVPGQNKKGEREEKGQPDITKSCKQNLYNA